MKNIVRTLPAGIALALAVSGAARAEPLASEQLEVLMEVESSCILDSPDAWTLDFGVYDVMSDSPQREDIMIEVRCTAGTTFYVTFGEGDNFQDGWRHMSHGEGEHVVPYALRFGGHQGTIWTETQHPAAVESISASQTYSYQVFGEVVAGLDLHVGHYSDTVLVNVELQ